MPYQPASNILPKQFLKENRVILRSKDEASRRWRAAYKRAACLGANPNIFFPHKGAGSDAWRYPLAKYCSQCPVRIECLENELAAESEGRMPDGIVGGTTVDFRKGLLYELTDGRMFIYTGEKFRRRETA